MIPIEASGRSHLSRRHALLVTLAVAPLGCRRPASPSRTATFGDDTMAQPARSGPFGQSDSWGGLELVRVSGMRDDERGGMAVVLLHGWGAPGDDLVPLAQAWRRPGARFFVPAAPLPEIGGGRAWWHLDPNTRPPHALTDQVTSGFQSTPEVRAARAAVQALIATIVEVHAPDTVSLVGFSQGAMLAIDVALTGAPGVERVVAMSGVLLQDSVAALAGWPREARSPAPRVLKPRFLLSHGRQDAVVPFASGSSGKDLLEKHGFAVTWRPFDGGHEIPRLLLGEVDRFLFPPP